MASSRGNRTFRPKGTLRFKEFLTPAEILTVVGNDERLQPHGQMTTAPRDKAVNRMATRANHRSDGVHILLVEDEPAIREVWADTLRDLGYAVDLAGTLSEAKARFAAREIGRASCRERVLPTV